MFPSGVALILLPMVCGACASYSRFNELIRRIHNEDDAKAAYFIGTDVELVELVGAFMKGHSDVPVLTTDSGGASERIEDVVILVIHGENENPAFMGILERVIRRLRVRKYVVISARTRERLHQMCAYFAHQTFMRIFGSAEDVTYAFLTFADKLVPIVSMKEPLPDAQRDLNGYTIRTPAHKSMPRVFRYLDSKGQLQIGGLFGQMLLSFVKMHNASFQEVPVPHTSAWETPGIWNTIRDDRAELIISMFVSKEKGYYDSYPVQMLRWTVMMPINAYLNPNQYFLRPFSLSVWTCIGATLLYIVLMDALKDLAEGRVPNSWRCFSRTLLMLLNMSSNGLIGNAKRIHIIVVLYAIVLVNLYLNHLTSFLTVFIRIKQYDTIQELVENKVEILLPESIWKESVVATVLPPNLEIIARPVTFSTFDSQLTKMQSTGLAFAMLNDKGEFLISMQSHSGKPLFRLIHDCISLVNAGFLMHPHSPFSEILTYFIIRSRETGLVDKWIRDTVPQAMKSGYPIPKGEPDEASAKPLSWNNLSFAWSLLAVGLAIGLVTFVFETLSRYVKAT